MFHVPRVKRIQLSGRNKFGSNCLSLTGSIEQNIAALLSYWQWNIFELTFSLFTGNSVGGLQIYHWSNNIFIIYLAKKQTYPYFIYLNKRGSRTEDLSNPVLRQLLLTCLFRLAVLALCVTSVHAYAFYRDNIPNGYNVTNPCNSSKKWDGVGHENPGGAGTRNPFGNDFEINNKVLL